MPLVLSFIETSHCFQDKKTLMSVMRLNRRDVAQFRKLPGRMREGKYGSMEGGKERRKEGGKRKEGRNVIERRSLPARVDSYRGQGPTRSTWTSPRMPSLVVLSLASM
jgi:hypothetical protein